MMPAGKYYVGDVCYVLENDWDEVCNFLFRKEGKDRGGESQLENGAKYAVYSTAWGDGSYEDNKGNYYGVDAGVIGCIKVDDLYKIGEAPSDLGTIHEFQNDFETGYDNGIIFFGDLRIETDPRCEEEEVESFCYCTAQGGARCICDEDEND
jgi:hypothetical protein